MKIVKKPIADLIQAEYNPRELTQEQYVHLKDSLLRFGQVDPIIVNTHADRLNIIVGGHQRSRVWGDLGNTEIECVEVELNLEREKELNIRLNKNTGRFDHDMLANHFEIDDLIEWGFDENELDHWVDEVVEEKESEAEGVKINLDYTAEEGERVVAELNRIGGSKEKVIYNLLF